MAAMFFCYLKGCKKCGGDLVFDEGDWKCWQCAAYYYVFSADPKEAPNHGPGYEDGRMAAEGSTQTHHPEPVLDDGDVGKGRRRGYGGRAVRNINALIRAKALSDNRWWSRNKRVIGYLDQGFSVREIARLAGQGERQIRVIRERLNELRAATS